MKKIPLIRYGIRLYEPDRIKSEDYFPLELIDRYSVLSRKFFWYQSRSQVILRLMKRYLGDTDARVFEIGCGTGNVLDVLSRETRYRLTGGDLSLGILRYAKKRIGNASFVQLDINRLPFRHAFDAIGVFDILEHLDDDEGALRQINAALDGHGLIFITVPAGKALFSPLDRVMKHRRRYERGELWTKLHRAGFTVLYMGGFGCLVYPLIRIKRSIDAWREQIGFSPRNTFLEELSISPRLNGFLRMLFYADEWLIGRGIPLPWGTSLIAVAVK